MVFADVWESMEDFHKMFNDPVFGSPEAADRQPEPQVLEIYELHNTIP